MTIENKQPVLHQKLTVKKIITVLSASIVGVTMIGGLAFFAFSGNSKEDESKIDYNDKMKYIQNNSENSKVENLIKKDESSDPYNSIVDPGVSAILSNTQPNSSNSPNSNSSLGNTSYTPLYTTNDQYAYKDNFDYDHASDEELRKKINEEEGKKLVKLGQYRDNVDDDDWRKNSNQPTNQQTNQTDNSSIKNGQFQQKIGIPNLVDMNGQKILGWSENGEPIIGYDKNGKPILGKNPQGIMGYDSNGNPITKEMLNKSLSFDSSYGKNNVLYDKNGNLIIGYDKNKNPIIGYDKNGKPILGVTEDGVFGYDINGKPIKNLSNFLYPSSGLKLYDKNGKPIIGWDDLGNPIVGYDSNGKAILGKVDKGVAGYDSNGKAITTKELENILTQKNISKNLGAANSLYDKNGKPIIGWNENGEPIIGYDSNGKPIIGKVDKGVAGYDKNGNIITKENLQKYLKSFAGDNVLQKSDTPVLLDKNGNVIMGYNKNGEPIIGYDSNGKPIIGKVDKGIAGYDINGNPIRKNHLSDYYNNNNSPIKTIDNIASLGDLNNKVPPINAGYNNISAPMQQTGNQVEPKSINIGGVNLPSSQNSSGQTNYSIKEKESKPWDEQLSKTNPEADRAPLSLSLSYKDYESKAAILSSNQIDRNIESKNIDLANNNSSSNNLGDQKTLSYIKYTKYTAKAGTFIPMIMQSGVNTDLPGSIIGKVSQNVYDTPTGKYLLIPQGSTLLGSYSANVTYGQTRVLIAWNSLIYPNGDEVKLSGQPGTDLEGYAGLNDQVNNHYWSLFGNTFILSVLSAGLEYNQNNSSNSLNNGSSFSSSLSNSSGQMMGQAAASVIQKSINIAPTLIIRNGFRGNVLLTQDLSLPSPYVVKTYSVK